VSAARSETRGRPPRRRARRRGFGSNGSRRAHSASSKRGCAMRDCTKSTAQVHEISQRFETRSKNSLDRMDRNKAL
jgi:hypothetical protein